LLYNTMLTMNTSNPQAAYLGNPSLFRSAPPIDFAETDLGYVGSQNKFLLKIPNGQVTIDAKRGQVFLIGGIGGQIQDLSAFGSGLNKFFTDHLSFEILRYYPNADTDNHFNACGLHGVYDSKYDRIIISKLDYIPQPEYVGVIQYDEATGEYYINKAYGDLFLRQVVNLTDRKYFCNKSWTLSYSVNIQSWISFHSYIPNYYIAENNFFYSGLNEGCDLEAIAVQEIPSPTTTTTTTAVPLNCALEGVAAYVPPVTTTTTSTSTSTTTTTTTQPPPANCTLTAGSVQQSYFLYSEDRFHFSNTILGTCIAVASPAYYQPGTLILDPVVKLFQDPQGLIPFPYAYVTDTLFAPPTAIYSYSSTTGVVGSSVSSCL